MKSINEWLNEYGESHQNHINKIIHFICVPLIFFSIVGLLYGIKIDHLFGIEVTLAHVILVMVTVYYFFLSVPVAVGMILYASICLILCNIIEYSVGHLFVISIMLFTVAWIVQFYGHDIEGKKPSFLKDVQFLLIGPAWIMAFLLRKMKIPI